MADRETAKEQETRTLEESFQALEQIMSEMQKRMFHWRSLLHCIIKG